MLDDLLDTAPCGFVSLAEDGTILRANTTLARMTGREDGEIEGQRLEALLTVGGRVFYQTHFFPLLKLQGHVEEIYLSLRAKNGEELPVLVNGAQIDGSAGVSYSCVLVPMSQRDRYEDELLQARKTAEEANTQLAEANTRLQAALHELEIAHSDLKNTQTQLVQSEKMRALGQMIAGVAHEINNPTAFVAGNIDYLADIIPGLIKLFAAYAPLRERATAEEEAAIAALERELDSEYLWRDLPELVSESREGLKRIRDIVLTLRNFARLEESDMKPLDINEGLQSTLHIVRPLCKDRVEIVESYGDLPEVNGHPRELNQVFLNLLMNSVQSIEGQGTVWITTEHKGDKVIVTIRDSGAGMDEVTLARLGEPFFTTKAVGSGTGLGLSTSFNIIEGHHGRILFSSKPGEGTTAKVELPVMQHD